MDSRLIIAATVAVAVLIFFSGIAPSPFQLTGGENLILLDSENFEQGLGGFTLVETGSMVTDVMLYDAAAFEGQNSIKISYYVPKPSSTSKVYTGDFYIEKTFTDLRSNPDSDTFTVKFAWTCSVQGVCPGRAKCVVDYVDLLGTPRTASVTWDGTEHVSFDISNAYSISRIALGVYGASSVYYNMAEGYIIVDDVRIYTWMAPLEISLLQNTFPAGVEATVPVKVVGVESGTTVYVTLEGRVYSSVKGSADTVDVPVLMPSSGTYTLTVKVQATEKNFSVDVLPPLNIKMVSWTAYAYENSAVEFKVTDSETGIAVDPEFFEVTVKMDGVSLPIQQERIATGEFKITFTPTKTGTVQVHASAKASGFYGSTADYDFEVYMKGLTIIPSSTPSTMQVGEKSIFSFKIVDASGENVEPDTVTFTVENPNGEVEVYSKSQLIRFTLGMYGLEYTPQIEGVYTFNVEASKAGRDPATLTFTVAANKGIVQTPEGLPVIPLAFVAAALSVFTFLFIRRLRG